MTPAGWRNFPRDFGYVFIISFRNRNENVWLILLTGEKCWLFCNWQGAQLFQLVCLDVTEWHLVIINIFTNYHDLKKLWSKTKNMSMIILAFNMVDWLLKGVYTTQETYTNDRVSQRKVYQHAKFSFTVDILKSFAYNRKIKIISYISIIISYY